MIHVSLLGAWYFTSLSIFSLTLWKYRWVDCVFLQYRMYGYFLVFFRKRLKGTCDYIYQTLFLDGEGSDVTIEALG